MKRFITGAMLLLATTFSVFSQTKNITVSGRVVEDTNEPAVQATIQLLSLPDSAYAAGVATTGNGRFTLPKVSAGKYVLKVSYIGFKNKFIPLHLYANVLNKNVGTVTLETDAIMLAEAVVTAEAPQVQVVEDTLMYNSTAYRTPEGAMLEELVKKLPGAEVDDDGNVKINGKELKKIMVDGKEFFGGDVKTGLKNLPVDMIDKLKTYDKQSDRSLKHKFHLHSIPFGGQIEFVPIHTLLISHTGRKGFSIKLHTILIGTEALQFPTGRHTYFTPFTGIITPGTEEIPFHHVIASFT